MNLLADQILSLGRMSVVQIFLKESDLSCLHFQEVINIAIDMLHGILIFLFSIICSFYSHMFFHTSSWIRGKL